MNIKTYTLFATLVTIATTFISCSKTSERNFFPSEFKLSHSEFIGDIVTYDTTGAIIKNVEPDCIKYDLLFPTLAHYPYSRIKINADSTVYYYYIKQELERIDQGYVRKRSDTLYFYNYEYNRGIFMRAFNKSNILYVPSYGYMYRYLISNPTQYSYSTSTKFGYPNIKEIINGYYITDHPLNRIYVQKFNLTYQASE